MSGYDGRTCFPLRNGLPLSQSISRYPAEPLPAAAVDRLLGKVQIIPDNLRRSSPGTSTGTGGVEGEEECEDDGARPIFFPD